MLDLAFDWLARQEPGTWATVVLSAVAWVWGTLRLGARSWQLTRFLAGAALAWWRKPSRLAVMQQEQAAIARRVDKLCGMWESPALVDPTYDGGDVKLSAADLCEGQQEMAPVVPHPATGQPVDGRTGKPLRGGLCGRGK